MPSTTLRRRDEIARIIRDEAPSSQQEILVLLRRKGLRVTQPTLSRDLREMGVIKAPDGYRLSDDPAGAVATFAPRESREDRFTSAVRQLVVSVAISGTLVILRTPPAEAQPVARAIDEADIDGVAGSLGGDDTVFVATTSARAARTLHERILSLLAPASRRRTRA